jgi:hypothetical protein
MALQGISYGASAKCIERATRRRAPASRYAQLRRLDEALDGHRCYIVTLAEKSTCATSMPTRLPHLHHQHRAGQGHPPAVVSPSLLRMSVVQRLAIAAALIALLWAAVVWAMKV